MADIKTNQNKNNTIYISGGNKSGNIEVTNNNAKYFSDKSLEYSNNAKKSAEEAKQHAENAENSKNTILNDSGFIAVSNNLKTSDTIGTVANNIGNVNFVGENIEHINQLVDDLENLGDTTNISIVATNITDVNTTAKSITNVNRVANSINSVDNIANNLTEVLNSKTYANNAKTSATSAQTYANNSLTYSNNASSSADLAQQWATSSTKVENTDYSSKYYANQAKSSATTATSQATIATNKANEAINTVANTLNKTQITNCLLEEPQNIKLELKDGVVTLKAGSVVTIPNGVGVFEKHTLTQDKTFTYTGSTKNMAGVFFVGKDTKNLSLQQLVLCTSGATAFTGTGVFYNTNDNKIHYYNSGTKISQFSFPICLCTFGTEVGGIASIDQVFNGIGYIGSTIWVDKGVKGLLPNGRNADGTLNNFEVVTNNVLVGNNYNTGNKNIECRLNRNENGTLSLARNTIGTGFGYDEEKNIYYRPDGLMPNSVCIAKVASSTKTIETFEPNKPVVLVKKGDIERNLVEVKAYITETYSSGTSWYDVYSNGKIRQGVALTANGTVTFLKPFSNTDYSIVSSGCIRYSSKTATAITISDINVGNSDKPFPCYLVFEGK